jgi:hypothetical protein
VTGQEPIPVRVSRKLKLEEGLITEYSGARLRMDLDRIPLWRGDDVGTRELWSYYSQYLYLPRLRDENVLRGAIESGLSSLTPDEDSFAYAEGLDEDAKRYRGLHLSEHATAVIDSSSRVVKAGVARRQVDEERPPPPPPPGRDGTGGGVDPIQPPPDPTPPSATKPRRFYGSVQLDPIRLSRDAGQIAEAIVQHLAGLVDANVEVRVEIQAESESGFPDEVVRTVTENANTLRFRPHGFDPE